MLIHLGQNEFIDLNNCELILNLETVDELSRNRILASLPELPKNIEYRAAVKTHDGRWLGSTLTTEALAQRGICHPFTGAFYLRPGWKIGSSKR